MLLVAALLSSAFLFALDNSIVADVQPKIVETFPGSIDKLPWLSVAFALGGASTTLVWLVYLLLLLPAMEVTSLPEDKLFPPHPGCAAILYQSGIGLTFGVPPVIGLRSTRTLTPSITTLLRYSCLKSARRYAAQQISWMP